MLSGYSHFWETHFFVEYILSHLLHNTILIWSNKTETQNNAVMSPTTNKNCFQKESKWKE